MLVTQSRPDTQREGVWCIKRLKQSNARQRSVEEIYGTWKCTDWSFGLTEICESRNYLNDRQTLVGMDREPQFFQLIH